MFRMIAALTSFALVASSVPVSAQAVVGDRLFERAFSAESIRRAVAGVASLDVASDQPDAKAWARVVKLKPGEEVVLVTASDKSAGERIIVHSDDAALTVLNVSDPALPRVAVTGLRDAAARDPQRLQALVVGGSWTDRDLKLRIGAEGLFVDGRHVAPLGDIVVRVEKADVVEVRRPDGWGRETFRSGFTLGFLSGLVAGLAIGKASGADSSDLSGMFWGGMIGGVAMSIWFSRRSPSSIYRRP